MKHDDLQLRRQLLLLRSAQLRLTLAQQSQVFRKPLALVDQARQALRWLADHPAWPLGTAVLLVVLRPARAISWGAGLWQAWRIYQQARGLISRQR